MHAICVMRSRDQKQTCTLHPVFISPYSPPAAFQPLPTFVVSLFFADFELKIASLPGWLERLLCSHLCTESLLKVLRQIASPSRLLERMAVEEFLLQMLRMCSCQHKGQLNSAEGDHPAHRMEAPGGLILPAPPAQVSRRESRLAMLQHCRTETSAPRCVRTEDSEIAELDA